MAKSRDELLDRWRTIEEEEEENDDVNDSSQLHRLHRHKEQWFADAYNFVISLPTQTHIWCGFSDLMGPLLETFYNYFKDDRQDSPLRLLWKRISNEMRHCLQCTSHHHQAQQMYTMEYESDSVGPLLGVLQKLDNERVTSHLTDINTKIAGEGYDPASDNAEVVNVLYEVLMFPILLDSQPLFNEFELFVEAIDNKHELALSGNQQLPGVYALLFCKRSVRSVGYRLAGSMGKLRRAIDLEPLQPLLKKFIGCLEADALPSALETSTRVQLDRVSLWIGIKSLLGFLDPPTFEEGILERYPFFLDIVLNHISGDSLEFSHAVTCLRLLFEMLGCKLWLRSTLSPSVMRNTLLGQCFHSRNEKIHKDIFGLFQPFLQACMHSNDLGVCFCIVYIGSLEALQDGEHEKQRRHFLYFLLHQVPVSSNFSILIRKLSCQIALLVVHRGYKMNPPCPPSECSHMWGPALVKSLKDSSLHNSLRQPAFDLIQTIIVSDATALIYSVLNCCTTPTTGNSMAYEVIELDDENDDIWLPSIPDGEKDSSSSWSEFSVQSGITSRECREWMCIPMLWFDVLVDINPSVLPVSFSKAVFWARSRFPMVELENSAETVLPVRSYLASYAAEISSSFGWKVPTGSDDGGGNKSNNSVEVLTMSSPLIKTFNRLTAHFLAQMGQGKLRSQWTWEPLMSESLILSLLDPNDDVRQFGKSMLEQISDTHGLSYGLKFLYSHKLSLYATMLGLKHAMKLAQLDSVLLKFHALHHFWFLLCKLLKDGDPPASESLENTHGGKVPEFSSQGGFLKQPAFDSLPLGIDKQVSDAEIKTKEKFCCLISEMAWPIFCKCLVKGKEFIDFNLCQMTCVRLLEILPVLVDKLHLFVGKELENFKILVKKKLDFKWLHDLIEWRKSSLKVVIVYWKRAVTYLMNLFKGSCDKTSVSIIMTIENIISSEGYPLEELAEQVSHLSISLFGEGSRNFQEANMKPKSLVSESSYFEKNCFTSDMRFSSVEDKGVQFVDSEMMTAKKDSEMMTAKKDSENVVILLDDEEDPNDFPVVILSDTKTSRHMSDGKSMSCDAGKTSPAYGLAKQNVSYLKTSKEMESTSQEKAISDDFKISSQKLDSGNLHDKPVVPSFINSKGSLDIRSRRETSSKSDERVNLSNFFDESNNAKKFKKTCSIATPKTGVSSNISKMSSDFQEAEVNPVETALKSVGCVQLHAPKPPSVLRRQVIQLKTPFENRSNSLRKVEDPLKRFKPPRLDDWYKPILEINYFVAVGLSSKRKDENQTVSKLKEVPVHFQSPEQYVEIFRPLVLEEFKAQLQNYFLEMSSWEEMFYGSLSVMSVERIDDFHLVRFVHDDGDSATCKSFSENDLLLLTKDPPQKTSQDVHMVGKVERREKGNKRSLNIVLVKFYFQNGSSRLNQARRNLNERSKWHACRIMSITSHVREFQALSSVKAIPLLPLILSPANDSFRLNDSKEVDLNKLSQPLQRTLRSSFNVCQLQAISVAIGRAKPKKNVELSLIQGPPGTGKTRTIVAIVSALLAAPSQKVNCLKNPSDENLNHNSLSTSSRPKISQSAAIARAWQDAALARHLNDDVQSSSKSFGNCVKQRVLICAQSNAAVDELVSRISSHGLYGNDGKMYKPYLVRVGNVKTVHPNSLPFFIDTLVDQRVAEERMHVHDRKDDLRVDSSVVLRSNLEKLVDSIRLYEAKRANLMDVNANVKTHLQDDCHLENEKEMSDAEIELKLRKLHEQKRQIYKDLTNVQAQEKKANDETWTLRNKLRKSILREAEIVVTTLSGCGGDLYGVCSETMLSSKFGGPSEHTLFDAVVIDEASQALEPATLIPLQLLKSSGTKCIMVGDPKQLPATVISNVASKFLYECSMFERLQRAGHPVIMLTEQYRMHPEICKFPSLHFYDNKLLNGCQMSSKSAPFHQTKGLGPYVFYDVIDGLEVHGKNSGGMSLCNEHEADAAVEVLRFLKRRYPTEYNGCRIGIITPYKCQLSLLRSHFLHAFGSSSVSEIEFNTVDGFQGREVDILLLSTVRATHSSTAASEVNSSTIGFVADVRRMNVALTRAKLSLWIFGNARTLQTNPDWAALLKDAKERNMIISAKMPYHSIFKTAENKCLIENPDKHVRPLEHEKKAKDSCQNRAKKKGNDKCTFERKRKCISSDVKERNKGNRDERAISPLGKDVPFQGSNSEEHISIKDTTYLVATHENRSSCDQQVCNSGRECGDKMKNSGRTTLGKRLSKFQNSGNNLDHSVEETDDRHKASKLESKRPTMCFGADRSSRCKDVSAPSIGCHKGSEADDQSRAPTQSRVSEISKRKRHREAVDAKLLELERTTRNSGADRSSSSKEANASSKGRDVDLQCRAPTESRASEISKRKQQREAVDAILSSSLLSTKKDETLTKVSAKKRFSSSFAKGSMKPPKTRNVRSDE
ncbi:putative DNA helicase [Lupinus albus]|uniref:Putative DNA helicase n=1 Tax=Lupinus albus TaxID=3870 RepID=A0A6A4N9W4_LUPAL|nr:putative DNA helicase [Lupinus albus]